MIRIGCPQRRNSRQLPPPQGTNNAIAIDNPKTYSFQVTKL
jgi:hypothetical protein